MINTFKKGVIATLLLPSIINCTHPSDKINAKKDLGEKAEKSTVAFVGNYVSDNYEKRHEGYDWVAVSVKQASDSTLHISVRSRADKKRPTCTFDAEAFKTNDSVYKTNVEGKNILFTFNKTTLHIKTEKKQDENILFYYCSGGGSLADTYYKIGTPLDKEQIDPRIFAKTLSMKDIGFEISTVKKGAKHELTIHPYGLEKDNRAVVMEIKGAVTNAEMGDLNSDGFPEVLIYSSSEGIGTYMEVIGFSVNNGKSLSQIYFPPISENSKAYKGYRGNDEFAIVETSLVHRFKTFTAHNKPSGNIRQIHYKLIEGEACRRFVAIKVIDYPAK